MMIRHVAQDDSVSADIDVIADNDLPEKGGSGTDVYARPDSRGIQRPVQITVANGHPLTDNYIVTNHCVRVDDYITEMLKYDSSANFGVRIDTNPKDDFAEFHKNMMN